MTNYEAQNKIDAIKRATKIKIQNKTYTIVQSSSYDRSFDTISLSGPRGAKKQILVTSYGNNQDIVSFRSQDFTKLDTVYIHLSQITIIA